MLTQWEQLTETCTESKRPPEVSMAHQVRLTHSIYKNRCSNILPIYFCNVRNGDLSTCGSHSDVFVYDPKTSASTHVQIVRYARTAPAASRGNFRHKSIARAFLQAATQARRHPLYFCLSIAIGVLPVSTDTNPPEVFPNPLSGH